MKPLLFSLKVNIDVGARLQTFDDDESARVYIIRRCV